MRVKYLITGLILMMIVSVFRAQEKKEGEQAPPPATAAQPAAQPAAAPAAPHDFTISPEDAARKNPLRFSEITVERGKKIYQTQCAMCHGEKGDGKGDIVADMKLNVRDFAAPDSLAKRTDGELFTIIQIGNSDMPGQGTRMSDTYKWELVNYLRALTGKTPVKSTDEELLQGTVIVPDKSAAAADKSKEKSKEKPKGKTTDKD